MALQTGLTPAQITTAAGGGAVSTPIASAGMQSYRVFNRSGLTIYVSDENGQPLDVIQPYVEKQGEFQIPSRSLVLSCKAGDPIVQSATYSSVAMWSVLVELTQDSLRPATTTIDNGQIGTWNINSLILNGSLAVTQSGTWNLSANITNANISVVNSAGTSIIIKSVGVASASAAFGFGGSNTNSSTDSAPITLSRAVRMHIAAYSSWTGAAAGNLSNNSVNVSLVGVTSGKVVTLWAWNIIMTIPASLTGWSEEQVGTIEIEMDLATVFPLDTQVKIRGGFNAATAAGTFFAGGTVILLYI